MVSTTSTAIISVIDLVNLYKDLAQLNLGYLSISVAILGVFFYFNTKPLKDSLEKQDAAIKEIKKNAQEVIDFSKKEVKEKLENFEEHQTKEILSLLNQESKNISLQVENQVTAFDRDITEKVDKVAEQKYSKLREIVLSEIKSQVGVLEKDLLVKINSDKSVLEKENSLIKTSVNVVKQNLKDIERRIKELELEEFARKNQMGAVYRAIELLKEDIDEKSEYGVSKSLDRLYKQIKDIFLEADDITKIEAQLVRLETEPKYKMLIGKIRTQLSLKEEPKKDPQTTN